MALVKISEILDGCCTDQKVTVRGWVYRKREGKELIFPINPRLNRRNPMHHQKNQPLLE